jgi:hypothetical protein
MSLLLPSAITACLQHTEQSSGEMDDSPRQSARPSRALLSSSSSSSFHSATRLLRAQSPAASPAAVSQSPRRTLPQTPPQQLSPSRASVPSPAFFLSSDRASALPPLSQQEMDELLSAFAALDRSSSGSIPAQLLISALSGLPEQRRGGGLLLALLSASPSALLSCDELLQLMTT